jgi:hypothetical protein
MTSPAILQPIFDKVAAHFLSMKVPSMTSDHVMCLYRDEATGNRCFVGALIQDEDYDPKIEGVSIRSHDTKPIYRSSRDKLEIAVVRGLNAMGIEIDDLSDELREALENLQVLHDGWGEGRYGREVVEQRLRAFAARNGLSDAALRKEVAA